MTLNDLGQKVNLPGHDVVPLDKKETVTHGEVLTMEQEMHQQAEALRRLGLLAQEVEQRAQKTRDLRIVKAYIVSNLSLPGVLEKLRDIEMPMLELKAEGEKIELLSQDGKAVLVLDFSIAGITMVYLYEALIKDQQNKGSESSYDEILAQILPQAKSETRQALRSGVTIIGDHEVNVSRAINKVEDELAIFNLERNEHRQPNQIIYRGYNLDLETGVESFPMHKRLEAIKDQFLETITKKKKIISSNDAVVSMITANSGSFVVSFTGSELKITGQVESRENLKPGLTIKVTQAVGQRLYRFEMSIINALQEIMRAQNLHLVDYTFTDQNLREKLSGEGFVISRLIKQINVFVSRSERPAVEAEQLLSQYLAYFEGFQRSMRDLVLARQRALDLQAINGQENPDLKISLVLQRLDLTIKNNLLLYEKIRSNFQTLYQYLETEMLLARASALQQVLQVPEEVLPVKRDKKQ